MELIKKFMRRTTRALGYDFRRANPANVPSLQLAKALAAFGIDLVLDVGANCGQFGAELRTEGYAGTIVSFEPLSSAHERLTLAAHNDRDWRVHPRCALGDAEGQATINISANSVSSSLLPMLGAHSAAAPESNFEHSETTPVFRLDDVAESYLSSAKQPFLKLDVQGYEWRVLDGSPRILSRSRGVLCELSMVHLYEGQQLWLEIISRLEQSGFKLWALQQGFVDARDGRTLQLDGLFFRDPP